MMAPPEPIEGCFEAVVTEAPWVEEPTMTVESHTLFPPALLKVDLTLRDELWEPHFLVEVKHFYVLPYG